MSLNDDATKKLIRNIRDSFRVRKNQSPFYVDVGSNLERIRSAQHQVIFGRRGSGKSCLLVHYMNIADEDKVLPIYVQIDEIKKLEYPDVLIRLLLKIVEEFHNSRPWYKTNPFNRSPLAKAVKELRTILDMADTAEITQEVFSGSSASAGGGIGAGPASVNISASSHERSTVESRFKQKKLEILERHLQDYKASLEDAVTWSKKKRAAVLVDDFYLLRRTIQPHVLDYLHRLLRDTDIYLKLATIKHRTTLAVEEEHTIGVELNQDVEEINLDRTLEDVEETQGYLESMMRNVASQAGIGDVVQELMNRDAPEKLALASGGVPRDYFNIFVEAVEASVAAGQTRWITPTFIWKGAGRLTYQSKLKNLRQDTSESSVGLERLFRDVFEFCIQEKKKTAFLISQHEAQEMPEVHERIQQLMDMKIIHVVEPDTSAASGRAGRYEAYTLDFALFCEPRRKGIEIVEFWKVDDNRRKVGIREAPVYPLLRAKQAFESGADLDEVALQSLEAEDDTERPKIEFGEQGNLF